MPPLIKPWNYDPQVVRDTVAAAIAASEKADERAAASADGRRGTPHPGRSREDGSTKPKKQAVMERPATDPDANTGDLASVCSVG